jgi:deoxyribonuclease IV
MKSLYFGASGIPASTHPRDSANGIKQSRALGLDAMEFAFVHSVYLTKEKALEARKIAEKEKIFLSVHAPYYINLNAKENDKLEASKKRIMDSCRIGAAAGARYVTFHPAYYMKDDPKKVAEKVNGVMDELIDQIKKEKLDILLAPETVGRVSQYGSLDELLEYCAGNKRAWMLFDFAHLHAYGNGALKTQKDFDAVFEKIKAYRKDFLDAIAIQVAGINYSEKGERNHLAFKESDFKYKAFLQSLKDFKVKGTIITESPVMEEDALLLQKAYNKL